MKEEIKKFMDSLNYEGKTATRVVEIIRTRRGIFDKTETYPIQEWYLKQVEEADSMKHLNNKDVVFLKGGQWWFHIEHKENKITNYSF